MGQYVEKTMSEEEMQRKMDEMRTKVAHKMDKWSSKLQFCTYTTPNIERTEGERWLEGGKTWIVQNGSKRSLSLLEEARVPVWCPICQLAMNHRFDTKFYYLRGRCFNCNIELEGKMRREGTWDTFEKKMLRENEKAFLKDKIQEKIDYIKDFKDPQIHFSDGRWEKLATKNDFSELFVKLEKDIDFMIQRLEAIKQEEENEHQTDLAGSER